MSVRLVVRLTPRAGQDRIEGWERDGSGRPVLRARTSAPPVDGRANAALERLIAKALGAPPTCVRVTAGAGARTKTVSIDGVDEAQVRARLGAAS